MMLIPDLRGQNPEIRLFDFNTENQPLSEALLELSRVSGVAFSFDGALFEKDPVVRLKLQQCNLETALKRLLEGSGVGWRLHQGQVVLFRRAPEYLLLSGYVEDAASGERLIGARVIDLHSGRSVLSNSYGYFCLKTPEGGDPLLAVYTLGYQALKWPVQPGKTKGLILKLSAQPYLMKEVSVSNSASGQQKSGRYHRHVAENLAHLRLKNTPSLGGEADLQRVIALEPGTSSSFDGLGGWSIRGGESDQNLVLMDDAVVFSPLHAFGLFSTFNPDVVRSAQLWKGDAPARLGGGASSVMEVRTREGNMQRPAGAVSLGWLASRASIEIPLKKERAALLLSFRRSLGGPVLQYFMNERTQSDSTSADLRYFFNDFNLKTNWVINRNNRLYLSLYSGRDYYDDRRSYQFTYDNGFEMDSVRIQGQSKHNWNNRFISLRWNHLFSERCFANTTLSRSVFELSSRTSSGVTFSAIPGFNSIVSSSLSSTQLRDLSLKTDVDYYVSPEMTIRGGFQLSETRLRPFFFYNTDFITPLDWVVVDSTGYITPVNEVKAEKALNLAVYAMIDRQITEALQVSAGLRAERFIAETGSLPAFQPRLSAWYRLGNGFSLGANVHWTTQFYRVVSPNYIESLGDFWLLATPELPAQRNRQTVLQLQKIFTKGWAIKVEAFHKRLYNIDEYYQYWVNFDPNLLPVYVDGLRLWQQEVQLGEGRVRGLECSIEKTTGRLSGSISCTFSRSERRFEVLNGGQWFPARFDRTYYLKSLLHYRVGKHFSVAAAWHLASGDAISRLLTGGGITKFKFLDLLQSGSSFERLGYGDYRQPLQHRLDLNANWQWRSKALEYQISAGLYNAYDQRNPHFTLWIDNGQSPYPVRQRINGLPLLPHLNFGLKF